MVIAPKVVNGVPVMGNVGHVMVNEGRVIVVREDVAIS